MITKLKNATIVTMNDQYEIIENGVVVIENDRILNIAKEDNIKADIEIDCKGGYLLPGLVDACVFYDEVEARGCTKLQHLSPKSITKEEQLQKCQKRIKTSLATGVTTLYDYSLVGELMEVYKGKIRVKKAVGNDVGQVSSLNNLSNACCDVKNAILYSADSYSMTDDQLMPMVELLKSKELPLAMPIHRSLVEIGDCYGQYNMSPIALLDDLGLLQFPIQLLYGTCMDKEDILLLKDKECMVTLCLEEDMSLGYGQAPIMAYQNQKINITLGTGREVLGRHTILGQIKQAMMVARSQFHNPSILPLLDVIAMCTNHHQKNEIGVLQKGFFADIILIEKRESFDTSFYHLEENLQWTMVGGAIVYQR